MAGFGSVKLKARPIRLAFLVDPNKPKQVREAIQLSSTIWGGAFCPIIPLHKKMPASWRDGLIKAPKAKNVILGYLDAFDPDIVVQFSAELPVYIKDLKLEIITPDEIWKNLREEKDLTPQFGIGIFEIFNDIFDKHFKYQTKYAAKIILPKLPKQYALFWASFFGEIPSELMSYVRENYSEPLEISEPDFNPDLLGDLLKGNVFFPRRLTRHELKHTRHSGMRRSACIFFMDLTKTEDIIDYWNLKAMGRSVLPMPKQLLGNEHLKNLIITFLKEHRVHWRHDKSVCDYAAIIRSRNSTMDELHAFAKTLDLKPESDDPSQDGFFSLQHWYPRVWDDWARDKDGALPDDFYGEEDSIEIDESDNLKVSFRSLLPQFADKNSYHSEPRCANDIDFRLYGSREYLAEFFPKFSGKNFIKAICNFPDFRDRWRIGRSGLVRLVHDNLIDRWEIPESEKIVFAWLRDLGWNPKLSPPGLLAKQIYKKLNGHIITLANVKLLGLLEHMSGGSVQSDGEPAFKNTLSQDRSLHYNDIKNKLQSSSRRGDLFEYLLSKEVFHVGLRVKCPNCIRRSWFPIASVDDRFICPLCLDAFLAIGNVEKADWCYKTAGPFSVPQYADGAYSTLLALEFFGEHKLATAEITPALSFSAVGPDKKSIEADFVLLWQDTIYGEKASGVAFGECKTYGKFQKNDFDRMRYIAKNFPGAVLVFSTLRKELTVDEIKNITRIAKAGRKFWKNDRPINPVLILTGNELLSIYGPPTCWNETGAKNKFDRITGLISICDATQQMYLNLPSWHDDWNRARAARRSRRFLKNRTTGKGSEVVY